MEVLSSEKEKIFPHQVSCAVLVFNICKTDNEDNPQLAQLSKSFRAHLILLSLDLIKRMHLDYNDLLKKLEGITSSTFSGAFNDRMVNMVKNKYIGIQDFFDSLEPLTSNNSHFVDRSSPFGIFLRKIYLNYQKMTFTDMGSLGKSVDFYVNSNRTDERQYFQLDGHSITMEPDACVQTSYSGASREEMKTLSQVGRFIYQQTKLLESQGKMSLSAKDLREEIEEILQKFPSFSDAYYLSYLNNFHAGEVRSALFDLHRYFDYKRWDDDQAASNGESALEKHQMKFKRFRYCALNLGIFHFYHGHYQVSLAALEEAVKMAQETNDNHCLLHALFWLYQLKLASEPDIANTMLAQFNRRAVELSSGAMRTLGILLECKSDVFGGKCNYKQALKKLKAAHTTMNAKHAVPTRNIQVAKSAFLDFFGYRPVACVCAQMVLHNIKLHDQPLSNSALLYGPLDPESSILATCQVARFLADEGHFLDAQRVLDFGNTLITEYGILHKWIVLCKWQLVFDKCIMKRTIKNVDDVIQPIRPLDKYDASLKECLAHYLRGNLETASFAIEDLLRDVENRQLLLLGNTPRAVYLVRALQLKAELLVASNEVPKAVTCLINCLDVCRRYRMNTLEAEIAISIAQCKIRLGLPHQAQHILNQQMLHILAFGTSYARSFTSVVLAKATLATLKGSRVTSKSGVLQQIPSLEKSLERFKALEAVAAQSEVLFILAQIYHLLDYTKKRNQYGQKYRHIHENCSPSQEVTLLI